MEQTSGGGIATPPALGPAPSPYPAPEAPVDISLSFGEEVVPLRKTGRPGQGDRIAGSSDQERSLEVRVSSRPPQLADWVHFRDVEVRERSRTIAGSTRLQRGRETTERQRWSPTEPLSARETSETAGVETGPSDSPSRDVSSTEIS